MNPGISPRFQASAWTAMASRIAASSFPAWACPAHPPNAHPHTSKAASRTRLIPTSEPGFPHSAYNESMAAAPPSSPFRVVHTVCSHDCPDSCAVLVTVNEEGRAIKVAGDPSQAVTNGFLCGKVAKYLDRV